MVFLLIDGQRNVSYVEFESAEKYTRLLQNTCSFSMDNSTRQLYVILVHFIKCGQMHCLFIKYCKFYAKIEL